jgi:hypothetical protein
MRRPSNPDLLLRWRLLRVITELERVSEQAVSDARGRFIVDNSELNRNLHESAKCMRDMCNFSTDKCREYLRDLHNFGSGTLEGEL